MRVEGAAGNLLFVLLKCCISQQSSSFSAWRYCYIPTTVGLTQFSICRQMDVLCWGLFREDCETTNYSPAAFSYQDFPHTHLMCLRVFVSRRCKEKLQWEKEAQVQSQKGPWQCSRSCPVSACCIWMGWGGMANGWCLLWDGWSWSVFHYQKLWCLWI